MKRIFVFLLLSLCGTTSAQQRPVAGYFCDGRGALRALVGVPGAWEAPILVPEGVVSAGYDGRLLWYKTEDSLHVRHPGGEWLVWPAPGGPAAARFSHETGRWLFHFPLTDQLAGLDPGSHELVFLDREGDPSAAAAEWPEVIGEGLVAERSGDAVLVRDPDGQTFLIPLSEAPGFQLFLVENGVEKPVGSSFVMPPAAPGDSSTARFRVRNTGTLAVVITRLSIDPGPFRLFDQFFPPRTIAPGTFADFWVRFSPDAPGQYARTLHINDLKVTLLGSSEGLPVIEIATATGWQALRADSVTQLGSVERRSELTRRVRVTPAVPLTVTGEGFQLRPEAEAGLYVLAFASDRVGTARGALLEGQRVFPVEVTVTDFPTPTPSVELLDEAGPARQIRLRVRLSGTARASVSATLRVTFTPESGLPDDAAVMLLPQAVRVITVPIPEGADRSGEILLQTGTTAGTIELQASIGTRVGTATIRIPRSAVVLTGARASAASANAEVVLTGYDTVRSASRIAFTFYLKSGQVAAPGRIEADIGPQFEEYYKTISGSAFRLRAHFPVTGTHTELDSVEVEITNSAGKTSTGRLRFE